MSKDLEFIDVTIRESVYLKKGMTEEKALVYLQKYTELMPFFEIKRLELCFLDNNKTGTLMYNPDFIKSAYQIVKGKYGLSAVLHPNLVDVTKWDPEVIKLFSVARFMINAPMDEHCEEIIDYLHNLGVQVSMNVIYISKKDTQFVDDVIQICNKHNVEQFTFADSCGSILPNVAGDWMHYLEDKKICMLKNFHFHNHFNLALANALQVLDYVDMMDCSVHGIGKGGGNLSLENIMFSKRIIRKENISQTTIVNYAKLLKFLVSDILEEQLEPVIEKYKNLLVGVFNCNLKQIADIEEQSNGDWLKFCELISINGVN